MNFYLWTIGCQMNFADSRRAAEDLAQLGFHEVDRPQAADLILLNTCVVRQSAEDKVTGRLTSLQGLKRRNPELRLALMGCFVNEIPALQHRYPWVDAFIQPSDIASVVALAQDLVARTEIAPSPRIEIRGYSGLCEPRLSRRACSAYATAAPDESPLDEVLRDRPLAVLGTLRAQDQRPYPPLPVSVGVPISYGCDHLCTYCIVRLRRGPEVSRPVAEIVAEVESLARRGVREVTLLGQNVDSYGRDLPGAVKTAPYWEKGGDPPDLADLLSAVHDVEGLLRVRFLTSHPADMSDRLIHTAARLPKVCEHMEVPVQSGDDVILRRMGRGYTVDQYRALVDRIRRAMPGVGLATDVIVGFPGETEAQFDATYRLLEDLRFDTVHVAAYSPRPGTAAARLPDDVPSHEKERRRLAVDKLQGQIVGEINAELLGRAVEILVEEQHRGKWRGRTRTNKLVFFDVADCDWTGQLVHARIIRSGPWSMQGQVLDLQPGITPSLSSGLCEPQLGHSGCSSTDRSEVAAELDSGAAACG